METKPTYNELLKEIEYLKQQLEEKKKLEKELEYTRILMRAAFDQSPVPLIVVTYPDFTFKIINSATEKFLLVDAKNYLNKRPLEVDWCWQEYLPDGTKVTNQAELPLPLALQGIKTINKEMRIELKDGTSVWELASASPIYNKEGEIIAGILAITDISDQKEALKNFEEQKLNLQKLNAEFNELNKKLIEKNSEVESQNEEYQQLNEELLQSNNELLYAKKCIEKSEERFRLMLKNSNDSFVLIDKDGKQIYISDAAERDTGFSVEELKGPIQNVILPPDLGIVMQAWEKVIKSPGEIVRVQYRHKHKYKDYIWYEAAAQNYLDNPTINAVVVNVRDITAIKETETKLIKAKEQAEANELKIKEQAKEIENFFNCAIDLLCIANIDGYFERLNKEWQNTLGYTHEELEGKQFLDFVHPDDVPATLQTMTQLEGQNNILNFSNRYRCKNGSYKWIEWRSFPYGNKIYAAARDITNRKQVEEELLHEKTFIEAIFNSVPGMLYLYDEDGKIVRWNHKHEIMTGFNSEEMSRMHLLDWYKDDEKSQKAVLDGLKTTMETGFGEAEAYLRKKDGTLIPMYFTASPLMLFGKQYFAGIGIDISERKRVEEELTKNEALIRTTIDNLPIIFYMIDNDGLFKLSIGAGLKSLGLKPNQVVGLSAFDLYKEYPQIIESVKKALAGEPATFESTINGASHFNIVTPFLISNKNIGIVGVALDITERKQIELEAVLAKEKAEENDRLKTAFLQNMSHEIRTPMNAIMGFAGLMAKNFNNIEKLKQFSKIIDQRCNDLLAIINDILDIAKIESGQISVNYEECNLNELFSELLFFFKEYQIRTGKQAIEFSMQALCHSCDNIIITDKVKLKQIFINLIGNAFKFTEKGKIAGGCKIDENNKLLFYVSDTGIGIPADKKEKVFERFTQLQHGSRMNIGGTGLGLSIVKGLIELLEGQIFLESELEKGSTFSFNLPLKTSQRVSKKIVVPDVVNTNILLNKSILIVEDDLYNAEYLKEILMDKVFKIYHTEYGKEAIDISISQPIDLVLMDIRLPDLSGYDATRQIKIFKPKLKIIAQTAYASQEERQKAYEAGCVDYIRGVFV
jgi:PAS domain S-box-containing protein